MFKLIFLLVFISQTVLAAEFRVFTPQDLKNAVKKAMPHDQILIQSGVTLDMSGEETVVIEKALTLSSESAKVKARIINKDKQTIFKIIGDHVTIKNLIIEGYQKDSKKKEILAYNKKHKTSKGVYRHPVTKGIHVTGNHFSLIHTEIMGFSHAAIFLDGAQHALIQKANIHHNQRWGLGYGICLNQNATAKIEASHFDFNRHSIAGSGHPSQSYDVSYSRFGDNHIGTPLDMHGGRDRRDGTQIAGKLVRIHHNIIREKDYYIFTHRGVAQKYVEISFNRLAKTRKSSFIGYWNIKKHQLPRKNFIFKSNQIID